jgi:APA family basic amino acid/polyamine antiporter
MSDDGPPRAHRRARTTRGVGSPTLFAIVYTTLAASIYFALGVVADHALALTPFVFLVAGIFFLLAAMTYVEGSSLHQDRGGATVFARYAFNELWSFVAGWAILLDYIILIAVTTLTATNYLATFWGELGHGVAEIVLSLAFIGYVAIRNVRGFSRRRPKRISALVALDLGLQMLLIIVGFAAFFDGDMLLHSIHLGSQPQWDEVLFALGITTVVSTGLDSASGLAGEVAARFADLRRLIVSATTSLMVVYVGVALVGLSALPVENGKTELGGKYLETPVLGITTAFDNQTVGDGFRYVFAIAGAATLLAAANSAMLGLSRLSYSLSTNRQIPSAVGRLHPTRLTPYVAIAIASVLAAALVIPEDLDFLLGIYAFGALLGLTIAHLSVIVLRFREPDRKRPYRMPGSVSFRGAQLPLPAVVGAFFSALIWISVVVLHEGARYVGFGWMAFGVALYVIYRVSESKPLFRRITVPESALTRTSDQPEIEYGSILVPITGSPLDDDIMQTAGRLAGEEHDDFDDETGATIEALWVFEVPMSLPIDARLPEDHLKRARAALARAKAVGEEYQGVEVATATVRARRAGAAIVEEAKRRGVEAIVLAAEEPSRIRGGLVLGGRGPALENFVGDITKHVVAKAPCQVILTAPPSAEQAAKAAVPGPPGAEG